MKKKILSTILISLTVGILLCLNNCSCIFGIAAITSKEKEPETTDNIQALKIENIKLATQVIVNLKDGTTVRGKYAGIDSIPNEKYDEKYAEIQKQKPEGSFLPSIGDTITVISELVYRNPLKFWGFSHGNILLSEIDNDFVVKLKLENLEKIMDKHGNETEGKAIRNLISEGEVPPQFLSRIGVDQGVLGRRLLAINDIERIQIKHAKRDAKKAFLIGAAVDASIILGVIVTLKYFVHVDVYGHDQ